MFEDAILLNNMAKDQREFCCRVCGQPLAAQAWGGGECSACGSVSATLLPSEAEIEAHYRADNPVYIGGSCNLERYARQYLRLCRKHATNGRLLDVGSATSPFPNFAVAAGFSVSVMDYIRPEGLVSEVSFHRGTLNVEDTVRPLFGSYDVVTAWAVIEHVPDPATAAKIIASCCRKGGVILLSTPEIGTWLTNHSLGASNWFDPPGHLHLISPRGILRLFGEQRCQLLEWGRLELNAARFVIRYGIGFCETLLGLPIKTCANRTWHRLRDNRRQLFRGITYYAFRRV